MRSLETETEVFLYTGACDMRLGAERLSEKVRAELNRSVLTGGLFVFLSRCRKKVRIFYWDHDGYAMWTKRLHAGAFKVTTLNGYETITGVDLKLLLEGLDLARIKMRKDVEKGLYV